MKSEQAVPKDEQRGPSIRGPQPPRIATAHGWSGRRSSFAPMGVRYGGVALQTGDRVPGPALRSRETASDRRTLSIIALVKRRGWNLVGLLRARDETERDAQRMLAVRGPLVFGSASPPLP